MPTPPPAAALDAVVGRSALLARLGAPTDRVATLISAPPGSGKTALVRSWLATSGDPRVRWSDHAPIADVPVPQAGEILVVDGAVGCDGAAVRSWVDAARPERDAHVVVLTSHDLAPELADLRLAGELEVVRAQDLAIDGAGMAELLVAAGHEVEPELAAAIAADLGGWLLGAVAVAGAWSPGIRLDDRHEVLGQVYDGLAERLWSGVSDVLPPDALTGLRSLARLPGVHPDLVDRLLGRTDGATVVQEAARAGALVAHPWHPDLWQAHPLLTRSAPEASDPHLTIAAAWYGDESMAIPSAAAHLARGDITAMGDVVIANLFELLPPDRLPELADLLRSLPPAVLEDRFMWALGISHVLTSVGDWRGAVALREAIGPGTIPSHQIPRAVQGAAIVGYLEDPTPCLEAGELVLRLCDEVGDDHEFEDVYTTSRTWHWRSQATAPILQAGSLLGEWERIRPHAGPLDPRSLVEIPPDGGIIAILARRSCYFGLGGWLNDAEREAGLAVELAGDVAVQIQTIDAHLSLAEVRSGRGDHAAALELARPTLDLCTAVGRPNGVARSAATVALALLELGRPDEARTALDQARPDPDFRPPPTLRGRLFAADAIAAHRLGLPDVARDRLAAAPTTSEVALAGVQIALEIGAASDAQSWIERWPDEPTPRAAVSRAAARAFVAEAVGDRPAAMRFLRDALREASTDGLLQPVTQLAPLAMGLVAAATADPDPEVGRTAVAAMEVLSADPVLAALTSRERMVLHHLMTTATSAEIARRLTVSPNTLRTQIRSLYRKLGASSRAEAVARARERS